MPDEIWKKAQTQALSGEGEDHFEGKTRLAGIFRRCGFYAELEHRFQCVVDGFDEALELRSDVYAVTPERTLCCEVDGPRGHKTTQAFRRDNLKRLRISETLGGSAIEHFTFHYKRLVGKKAWTDKEIAEEMKIASYIRQAAHQMGLIAIAIWK